MSRKRPYSNWRVGLLVALFIVLWAKYYEGMIKKMTKEHSSFKTAQTDSTELRSTIITPHLEQEIFPGKNVIYCATFQLAWNELRDDIIGEDIRLINGPAMAPVLNKKAFTKNDLSDSSYVAMAGFGRDDIVEKINKELQQKFAKKAPKVEEELVPDSILAYAFLFKELEFSTPFEKLEDPIYFSTDDGKIELQAFGIDEFYPDNKTHKKLSSQVEIYSYDWDSGEIIIGLKSKLENDEIVLAKIQPKENLLNTYQAVADKIDNSEMGRIEYKETLGIPKFDFDIKHEYQDLLHKYLLNPGFTDYFIAKARHDIRFKLSEAGALLKSEAKIAVESVAENRAFVFRPPYLIYIREKNSQVPYLAIWVDNAELLFKSE
jgi:hypothetical protein